MYSWEMLVACCPHFTWNCPFEGPLSAEDSPYTLVCNLSHPSRHLRQTGTWPARCNLRGVTCAPHSLLAALCAAGTPRPPIPAVSLWRAPGTMGGTGRTKVPPPAWSAWCRPGRCAPQPGSPPPLPCAPSHRAGPTQQGGCKRRQPPALGGLMCSGDGTRGEAALKGLLSIRRRGGSTLEPQGYHTGVPRRKTEH